MRSSTLACAQVIVGKGIVIRRNVVRTAALLSEGLEGWIAYSYTSPFRSPRFPVDSAVSVHPSAKRVAGVRPILSPWTSSEMDRR